MGLRSLSVDQQVALLFVAVFGALLIASIAWVLWSLRQLSDVPQRRHERFGRDLRAVWIAAVLFWLAWMSGAVGAGLLFGIVSFLALREFITLMHTRRADHRGLLLAFFIVLPLQFVFAAGRWFDLFTVFIPVYVFFAIPVTSALAGDPGRFLERNAKIQWGIMVCVYGLSHAPALLLLEFPNFDGRGAFLLFFLVTVVACAQLAQEAASRRLRALPTARHIDRNFSLRGWLIAIAVAALIGGALYWITPFKPLQALVLALLAGTTGTLGSLVVRALKRDAGVAAWGHDERALTGAVGLLDRIAPLAFAAPIFFHLTRWYFGV
jgi:phosphatidate cytidylyltransferase